MKSYLIAPIILILSGCANVTFDSTEFDRFVTVKVMADTAGKHCGEPIVTDYALDMQRVMYHEQVYAKYKWGSSQVLESTISLNSMITNFLNTSMANTISKVYCEQKMDNISQGAIRVMQTIGGY